MNPLFELAKVAEVLDRAGFKVLAKKLDSVAEGLIVADFKAYQDALNDIKKATDLIVDAKKKLAGITKGDPVIVNVSKKMHANLDKVFNQLSIGYEEMLRDLSKK